jgi:hypothetical protein
MPSLSEENDRGQLLIFDTGVIRELVLFYAVQEFGFERLRRGLRFIKNLDSYEKCGQFIALFRRKTTSASVVAELYQWIRTTDSRGQRRLWNRVYEEFRAMDMNEEVVRLVDMDIDLVQRFGPVDISLIELARRHTRDNPRVLTADEPLHGKCKQWGLPVSHVQEIVEIKP